MKRLFILLLLLFSSFTYADTINLHWLNEDGSTYQNSTCVIDSDLILPSTPPTKYGYTFTGWKLSDYIFLEYIEGWSNTQYINTDVVMTSAMNIYAKVSMLNYGTGNTFFGVNAGSDAKSFTWFADSNSNTFVCFSTNRFRVSRVINLNDILELNVNNQNFILKQNGTIIDQRNTGTGTTTPQPLYLNGSNNNGMKGTAAGLNRIYQFTIEGIADMKPAQRIFDGAIGMYDTVRKRFFTNVGTGNFVAGPVLQ